MNGLYVSDKGNVLITYGSADVNSRVLSCSLEELEGMFSGRPGKGGEKGAARQGGQRVQRGSTGRAGWGEGGHG